ncbi:LuxR family transcriptional regulator [Pseudonocardia sp. EC080610-09]|uniref:LuxR C-terminal-related transcriptional regulator n=1 Tax=unclassified Pseudonocardia TaxID=2619320 RepID=UPI0006CB33E8|nr:MULTISPECIES: response regulator transcription factor [unclassified Pseudonocardia]ALE74041.1 LuxR family transcriptional regulator [Pseudonocardia sp. EC080625-04]ALL77451.1 LuxR family transcriptional regulator [Pseudonocardia sp. EC080610-09]ALL80366.1 LuxR family transcriptional regulator [Pseudonocardia sp. EC080619-01]
MTVGVLLVDDDAVRAGLRAVVAAEPDLTVVGETARGAEAPGLVAWLRPDVVLAGVRLHTTGDLTVTRDLLARPDPPRVLVLTTFGHDRRVYDALCAGASGFLLRRTPSRDVARAVRTVAAGEALLFPAAVRELVAGFAPAGGDRLAGAGLTAREGEVLRLAARGLSDAEIADELRLDVPTVTADVAAVLAKTGARHRTQAVVTAYASGFVDPRFPVR